MAEHTFKCSDTPGVFECPVCPASAHFEREEKRYCIHPFDESEPAFLVDGWNDSRIASAHAYVDEAGTVYPFADSAQS